MGGSEVSLRWPVNLVLPEIRHGMAGVIRDGTEKADGEYSILASEGSAVPRDRYNLPMQIVYSYP
jgi:hypothetical protein